MSTPSMIWVLVRATEARDQFLRMLDNGNFKGALDMKGELEGMVNQLKSFIQKHGAGCPICCEDAVAMKIPVNLAENLESMLDLYLKIPGIAVGVGFNFLEASAACQRSKKTRKIELYRKQNGEQLNKASDPEIHKLLNPGVVLPTNLFDPTNPSDSQYLDQLEEPDVVQMPGFQAEIQAESAYIKVLGQQMGAPSDEQIQQAQQVQQQQMETQKAQLAGAVNQTDNPNAKSMLSALGKNPPKPNNLDEAGEEKEETEGKGKSLKDAVKKDDKKSSESGKKDDKAAEDDDSDEESDDKDGESGKKDDKADGDDQEKLEDELEEAETAAKDDHNQRLFDQLDRIKSDLPQLMGLREKNPEAFKDSMKMVNKLLDVAKQVRKGEIDLNDPESLEKARLELNLPLGTRKGAKRKIQVGGKDPSWRSMKTGQLKDETDGSPISVREHNVKMQQKTNQ